MIHYILWSIPTTLSSIKIQLCFYIMHVSGQRQQLKRRNLSTVFNVNLPTKTASECLKGKTKAFGVVKVFNMYGMLLTYLKGNWSLKFPFYISKYQPLLKQKVLFFFHTCNAVAARDDRKRKYLGLSYYPSSWIEFDVFMSHNVKRDILNMACDCWFSCSCVYWSLVKARKSFESLSNRFK